MGLFTNDNQNIFTQNDQFTINGNLFLCEDMVIQLDNVTRVAVAELPKASYKRAIVSGLIAIVCFIIGSTIPSYGYNSGPNIMTIAGWVMLVLCGGFGFSTYRHRTSNRYGLFVELNSGKSLIYPSPNTANLNAAMRALTQTLINKTHGSYTFNVVNGTMIDRSTVNTGNGTSFGA